MFQINNKEKYLFLTLYFQILLCNKHFCMLLMNLDMLCKPIFLDSQHKRFIDRNSDNIHLTKKFWQKLMLHALRYISRMNIIQILVLKRQFFRISQIASMIEIKKNTPLAKASPMRSFARKHYNVFSDSRLSYEI